MSWGVHLWDQLDNVSEHTYRGIDQLDRLGRMFRERCDIENRYSSELRSLVKKHMSRYKDEADLKYTNVAAVRSMLSEWNDLAGQHELFAEDLGENVIKDISLAVRELKNDRKRLLSEAERLQVQLKAQYSQLDKSKRNYDKGFKEAEKALETYRKADDDLNLSRAEVKKHLALSNQRSRQCDDAKNEYGNQLQKTNDLQHLHYSELMPSVFEELRRMDQRRCRSQQEQMSKMVGIHRGILTIVNRCLDGMSAAVDSFDTEKDAVTVIDRYKSGFEKPEDIPFEDLAGGDTTDSCSISGVTPNDQAHSAKRAPKPKKKGGIWGRFANTTKHSFSNLSYEGFIKEGIESLPPNQRRKHIEARMHEISTKINQETSARDGLVKMKEVYEGNNALGDPATINQQLQENSTRIENLRSELHKFQTLLESGRGNVGNRLNPEALSRSASESSMNHPTKTSAPPTPRSSHVESNSPESGLGTSHTSLPDSESDPEPPSRARVEPVEPGAGSVNEYFSEDEDELLPVLGDARALYLFDATNEGSISIHEGEQLLLIEADQGDGWTRVRRRDSLEEGFVPTAYLEVKMHPAE